MSYSPGIPPVVLRLRRSFSHFFYESFQASTGRHARRPCNDAIHRRQKTSRVLPAPPEMQGSLELTFRLRKNSHSLGTLGMYERCEDFIKARDMTDIQSSDDQLIGYSARDSMPAQVECPSCHGINLVKNGKSPGTCRQKYLCLNPGCRRQFTAGSNHLIDPKIKTLIIEQLARGMAPIKIVQYLSYGGKDGRSQISIRWIYELRRKMKQEMSDQCRVFADQRIDPKVKDIILNMLSAGVKPSQIKKIVGDDISLRHIYKLRQKKKRVHDR